VSEIENKDVLEAIDRLARSPDGQILYRHLQKALTSVARPETSDCALRQLEGRRMFASELMGLMAKGIADSDRYAITFVRSAEPRQPASRGAGRRITPDTVVPGWNDPAFGGTGNTPDTSGTSGGSGPAAA
jgi:hypothetical protein